LKDTITYTFLVISGDPMSFQEALPSKNSDKWLIAIEEEMNSLHKNET